MTDMGLADWLAHLETLHPKSIDLGLERITSVAERLGVRATHCKTITVAGTNGKGSCVATLDALLRRQGYRVGVYTSPHLMAFNERIAIDGAHASDADILDAFNAIETARGEISLSYFEFATLAALWLFRRAGVDIQVLEVGLGGRLDAVNLVDADACVITSIGLDHTEWLGDTRECIAVEKAGVARLGCPAVVADNDPPKSLLHTLESVGARASVLGIDWTLDGHCLTLPDGSTLTFSPSSALQASNLAAAAVVLFSLGLIHDRAAVIAGLNAVTVPGRQQRLGWQDRDVWCDVAHNRESVAVLVQALIREGATNACHAVFAGMADKPLGDMIGGMSTVVNHWHLAPLEGIPRAASPQQVAAFTPAGATTCYEALDDVLPALLAETKVGDRIVVFGSFVTVGAMLQQLHPTKVVVSE